MNKNEYITILLKENCKSIEYNYKFEYDNTSLHSMVPRCT